MQLHVFFQKDGVDVKATASVVVPHFGAEPSGSKVLCLRSNGMR